MLYIGKIRDPFFLDEIDTVKIDATNYLTAKEQLQRYVMEKMPLFCTIADTWVELADDQPDDVKTYAVFCRDTKTGRAQNNYPDTLKDATDLADVMSRFYDDVEICYGWPGHWAPVFRDEEGVKIV